MRLSRTTAVLWDKGIPLCQRSTAGSLHSLWTPALLLLSFLRFSVKFILTLGVVGPPCLAVFLLQHPDKASPRAPPLDLTPPTPRVHTALPASLFLLLLLLRKQVGCTRSACASNRPVLHPSHHTCASASVAVVAYQHPRPPYPFYIHPSSFMPAHISKY